MGYRVPPDVNRIGRPKVVTSIPILLGHYRQLRLGAQARAYNGTYKSLQSCAGDCVVPAGETWIVDQVIWRILIGRKVGGKRLFSNYREFYNSVIIRFVVPSPKIAKNLLRTNKKQSRKGEQYRFSG